MIGDFIIETFDILYQNGLIKPLKKTYLVF